MSLPLPPGKRDGEKFWKTPAATSRVVVAPTFRLGRRPRIHKYKSHLFCSHKRHRVRVRGGGNSCTTFRLDTNPFGVGRDIQQQKITTERKKKKCVYVITRERARVLLLLCNPADRSTHTRAFYKFRCRRVVVPRARPTVCKQYRNNIRLVTIVAV